MDTIELSTLDYVFTMSAFEPISFTLKYRQRLDVERILQAFHETAQRFPGVCGVLAQRDRNSLYLDVSRQAVQIEVSTDSQASSIDVVESGFGKPLACVRITRGDSETSIGFSMSHVVGDAYSYFMFLASWAAQCRGQVLVAPSCSRSLLRPSPESIKLDRCWDGQLEHSGLYLDGSCAPPLSLKFEHEALDVSMFAGNKELGLSSNDMLSAALWKRVTPADATGPTTYCSIVDIRRFRPELGPTFFGNAILNAITEADAQTLNSAPTEEVAGWIRASTTALPNKIDHALAELESLRLCEGVEVFRRLRSRRATGMLVTNVSRLPYSVLHFGAGPPAEVEPVLAPSPAPCAVVLPSVTLGPRVLVARARN